MEKALPLQELTINQVYNSPGQPVSYIIPIYQRNYAWEEDQIATLIKDIYDAYLKHNHDPYYIGTLVTYKRGDNRYEVIDGQQRLTTIYLILKALGVKPITNKLTYSARRVAAMTLENLPETGEESEQSIKDGFEIALRVIKTVIDNSHITGFTQYFLNNVIIIHYKVPKDIDLNHYFEVMNSRGEQLEKHEIVKSKLCQAINSGDADKDNALRSTFCHVWEACSEMSLYIQQTLKVDNAFSSNREHLIINSFEEIDLKADSQGKSSIYDLLNTPVTTTGSHDSKGETNDKFQPILDFPNFLLITLKLTILRDYKDIVNANYVILDDKELLNEFDKIIAKIEDRHLFVSRFIFNLLKARFFLDNFIVHHSLSNYEVPGDNPWNLKIMTRSGDKEWPRNLSSDLDEQQDIVQLLSMFEVSFSPKQRKNYLLYCLTHLFDNDNLNDYRQFLRQLAHKYFFDIYLNQHYLNERCQPVPNAFDNVILPDNRLNVTLNNTDLDYRRLFKEFYPLGFSDIPLFVFNYTDYLLWQQYAANLRGNKLKENSSERKAFFDRIGCSDFGLDTFRNFYFSRTRKSLEHFYPRSKAVVTNRNDITHLNVAQINCFGNFAMIGADANSSGSALDPRNKLERYSDTKANQVSVASLKFKIMLTMCRDNYRKMIAGELSRPTGMEWNFEDIAKHQSKMLDLLMI